MSGALTAIRQYRRLGEYLHSAGQPTARQLDQLGEAGIGLVVNLALPDSDHAVPDEADRLEVQGIGYSHQPIDFAAPSRAHLARLAATLAAHTQTPVLVHCAYNMRVSAMLFLYRVLHLGVAPATALPDLLALWTPTGPWRVLLDDMLLEKGCAPLPHGA
ncbi:MAG: protein tyrosine phosphatase family protein [Abyssibacter sp.]|uniref:protein tyrosine phosphatase family protein n=1 Tax=Abyssibacter sp. TaxID=2320200 RepID=UPI0032192416